MDRYLDLIAEFPHVKQSYHHLVLLYLKSGNHLGADKLLELFVSLFNDFEGRGLLMLWVSLNYISSRTSDKTALYQKRLECLKDDPLVTFHDTYALFLNSEQSVNKDEFPDLLHPNGVGYAKWTAALQPIFEKLKLGVPAAK